MKDYQTWFERGFDAEEFVCEYLKSRGYKVKLTKRKEHIDANNGKQDDGDIHIWRNKDSDLYEILMVKEKSKTQNFTSLDDFPFNTVFITETYKADKKYSGPLLGWMILNLKRTHYIWIPYSSKHLWTINDDTYDKYEKRKPKFYQIHKRHIRIYRFI